MDLIQYQLLTIDLCACFCDFLIRNRFQNEKRDTERNKSPNTSLVSKLAVAEFLTFDDKSGTKNDIIPKHSCK